MLGMIAVAAILGAVIVGVSLLSRYWSKIVEFMKQVIYKLKARTHQAVLGCRVSIRRLGDRFQNRTKHYSKNELGNWKETTVTCEMDKKEVPEKYPNYARLEEEFDLTPELQLQLQRA